MLTYLSLWAFVTLCCLCVFIGRSGDLVSALVWGEIVWSSTLVVCGLMSASFSSLGLIFLCVTAMCFSAVELAVIVALVSGRLS